MYVHTYSVDTFYKKMFLEQFLTVSVIIASMKMMMMIDVHILTTDSDDSMPLMM